MSEVLFFKQVQEHTDNFTYIVADKETREAAVVDSSFNANEVIKIVKAQGFTLKYVISTHGHSDHTAGNQELQSIFGAKIVAHKSSKINPDISVEDGDVLQVGKVTLKTTYTPGHTIDSICVLVNDRMLITGDTLFVGECGRTDMPGGNAKSMYYSLFDKILKFEDTVEIYPGHDYGATPRSTVGRERSSNYTLQPRSLKDFLEFMRQP